MPIQEESNDIFVEQEEECNKEIQREGSPADNVLTGGTSTINSSNNSNNNLPRISLIPPNSTQVEKLSHFQPRDLQNLSIPAGRIKRPQQVTKDIENEKVESIAECSNSNIVDKTAPVVTTLIHKPHSELALTIDKVTTASRAGLDLAGICTNLAFEAAKLSTRAGLGIAKTVTGVMSDRLVQTMPKDGSRLVGTSTDLLHRTLNLTEQIALAGLEFTSDTVQFAFGTANESMSIIDTLFGTTDAAKALAEFVQLVKREFNISYEKDDNLEDNLGTFGAFRVIKSLTAWACLQYVTNGKMERDLTGWKKVKLVDISDMYDWVHVSMNEAEENIYDELEYLLLEEEDDEEMVIIKSQTDKSNNIVIGELTPKDEIPEFRFSMSDERSKRLSDIYLDATKRLSNPYLEEFDFQTNDEKLFSLLHNLKRYSKFSSNAYSFKTAIIGKIPFPKFPIKSPVWKERGRLHRFTFASNTDLPSDSIVDSSHAKVPKNPRNYQPSYFIIRDHTTESIILALRGTMSIHDLIVDLTCEYEDFQFPEDIQRGIETKHKVHKGMFQVAKRLAEPGESGVFEVLKRELEANEGYGLVLVGHSLGAGVASLLALLFASPTTRQTTVWSRLPRGRRVHAYSFATPCTMSAELSKRMRPLVTSVAYGSDFVCRLSLGHVRDLRDMVRFLGSNKQQEEKGQETASKILKKVLDYQSRTFNENTEEGRKEKEEYENLFWKTRQDVYEYMQNEKLYPPGKVYWIASGDRKPYCDVDEDVGETFERKNYNMLEIEDVEKFFAETWFSPRMMLDHLPHVYENVLKKL